MVEANLRFFFLLFTGAVTFTEEGVVPTEVAIKVGSIGDMLSPESTDSLLSTGLSELLRYCLIGRSLGSKDVWSW